MGAESLRHELQRLDNLVADLGHELNEIHAAAAAAPPDDEHDVEGASVGFERERVRALLITARQRRSAVADVLARTVSAEQMTCRECGDTIPEERLEAVPGTDTCTKCAQAARRPGTGPTSLSRGR